MRWAINFFFVLIGLFIVLMAVNLIGSFVGDRSDAPQKGAAAGKPPSAEDLANQALASAKISGGGHSNMAPYYKEPVSSATVRSEGAIMLVKDKTFSGVAEKPKTMNEVLEELGGGKKKPAPVTIKDKDLDKKINIGGSEGLDPKLKVSSMPELGRGAGQEGVTMLKAPVDFKVFKDLATWQAFANTHKCASNADLEAAGKLKVSPLSGPDFPKEWVVTLVSLSDLPNGIFKIVNVEKAGKELRVSYRVDPLAMSAAATRDQHDFYSAAVIPSGLPVKLTQVP